MLAIGSAAQSRRRSWKPATQLKIETGSEARSRRTFISKKQKQPKIRRQPRLSFLRAGLNANTFT
jgi:hypothetical protein